MFSYWTKKTNKNTERKGIETIEDGEQNQGIESTIPAPCHDERLQEFQEFLKRVQTLQMSPTTTSNLGSEDNYFFPAPIEVGVEPSMQMELDEKYAITIKGSTIAKNNFNSNSANIRVNVGIDKDLEMILEMDPSIVDLGDISAGETTEPRIVGLPPFAGG